MRWYNIYYWYTRLNRFQKVKQYTKKEIEAYKLTKPESFFVIPTKASRVCEKWIDINYPKNGVDEAEEMRKALKVLNRKKVL